MLVLRWQIYFWWVACALTLLILGLLADFQPLILAAVVSLLPLCFVRFRDPERPIVQYPLPWWTVIPIGIAICITLGGLLRLLGLGHLTVKVIGVTVGCAIFLIPIAPTLVAWIQRPRS
jgi:hypothetical protein